MLTRLIDLKDLLIVKVIGLVLLVVIFFVAFASATPQDFPKGIEIHIAQNTSLTAVSAILAEKHVISSPFLFKIIALVLSVHKGVIAGDYLFTQPQNLWVVAGRLVRGEQGLTPIKVTIPEGSTVSDIALILLKKIPDFNAPYFTKLASTSEGYLFPDTYTFYPNETPDQIFNTLHSAFESKTQSILLDTVTSSRKPEDVVTMASILEKEATSSVDRAVISGILWKRIDEGMRLQVDPPLAYITSNTSGFISLDDTKINSPYNTYLHKGLPPGPIGNPGLDALKAAAHPVKTPYYYYLSDTKGNMHYAVTYAQHLVNKAKYVK